jgi:hypothetical protein
VSENLPPHVLCAAFIIDPLGPTGTSYGINGNEGDMCRCNTVAYSLISACSACQGGIWHPYDSELRSKAFVIYLPLGGLNIHSTAQGLYLLLRELPMRKAVKSIGIDWVTRPRATASPHLFLGTHACLNGPSSTSQSVTAVIRRL